MRTIPILSIVHSPIIGPAYIEIAGDFVDLFHGKEWIDTATGTRYPFYTYTSQTAPYGVKLLPAASFSIKENELYDGNYSVFTKQSAADFESVELVSGNTRIRISQTITTDGSGTQLTSGVLYNLSVYSLEIFGEADKVVIETELNGTRPIELVGRNFSGWGEILLQNQIKMIQNFSAETEPVNAFVGQLWFKPSTEVLHVFNGAGWVTTNSAISGNMFRHTQTTPSTTWTINHELGERIVAIQVFKNTGLLAPDDVKIVLPNDVTFNSTTQVTVTFSNPESGYAIIKG